VGDWAPRLIRTAQGNGARLAVLGVCSADGRDLASALTAHDLAGVIRTWAGSHTVIRVIGENTIEVISDAAGACPLYTVHSPHGLVWGSSSRALSALVGGRVDTVWLSSYLWDKKAPVPGRSSWAGVAPVPAGTRLLLRGPTVTASTWWSPYTRSRDEAMPAIRRALMDGVRTRVEGVPASTDLAGMDSTTLAVIAARHGPVTGMTMHPAEAIEGGDLQYARALTMPSLTRTFLPLEERHLPFTPSAEPMPAADEPPPSTAVWSALSAQLRTTASAGSTCHLTGDGGDNLFLPSPTHLLDLARDRRWLRLVRDALDWARLRRQSPRPLIRAALRGDAHGVTRPWFTRPHWIAADIPAPTPPAGGADDLLVAAIRTVARAAHADTQLADTLGVELHNPYFDGAVLDAVVSVPSWDRFSARRYKPVLVDACGDLLPELHRQRASKGVFAGDFHRGLRANLPRLLDLTEGRLAALRLIDPAPLAATLHTAALGARTVWATLLPTLAAEVWLRTVESASSPGWETPPRLQAGVT
jgi:asparagine synthase (glutamine-hydrolysing)